MTHLQIPTAVDVSSELLSFWILLFHVQVKVKERVFASEHVEIDWEGA